jgi:hypothetical protein
VPHSDIRASMIALISIGKPDFDANVIFRGKPDFFTKAIGIHNHVRLIIDPPILMKLDSGNDSKDNFPEKGTDRQNRTVF